MNHKKYYSSWGNFPIHRGKLALISSLEELSSFLQNKRSFIPVGNFRSYGDCALSKTMVKYNGGKKIKINKQNGSAIVSGDVIIGDLIHESLPLGWFPAVVPGTKFVTIGGAIAADIHGKNHHKDGCFSNHVKKIDLMTSCGNIVKCSPIDTPELFRATCGGMGLTGIILNVEIQLIRVESGSINQGLFPANSFNELFELFYEHKRKPYSVAWLDCTAKGKNLGRGILFIGEFLRKGYNKSTPPYRTKLKIPFFPPSWLINHLTIRLFNFLYFHYLIFKSGSETIINYDSFFFPLDGINQWNRLYGKSGFLQYQFVLPLKNSKEGMEKILKIISESGQGSPLAVLKLFGPRNENYLSFPIKGFTLALDFKNQPTLYPLLDQLDKIVLEYEGKIYLAKDARIKAENFESGYNQIQDFRHLRYQKNLTAKFQSYQSRRLGL